MESATMTGAFTTSWVVLAWRTLAATTFAVPTPKKTVLAAGSDEKLLPVIVMLVTPASPAAGLVDVTTGTGPFPGLPEYRLDGASSLHPAKTTQGHAQHEGDGCPEIQIRRFHTERSSR